jgi:hypothetical protein
MATGVTARETPYKRFYHSPIGRMMKERPVLAGAAQAGAAWAVYEGARRSPVVSHLVRKGVLPATGAGLAWLGASMTHDGLANDLHVKPTKAGGKVMFGAAMAAGGVHMIGSSYGWKALANASRNWSIVGASAVVSGGLMAYDAVANDWTRGEKVVSAGKVGGGLFQMGVGAGIFAAANGWWKPALGKLPSIDVAKPWLVGPAIATVGAGFLMKSLIDGEEHKTREVDWCKRHIVEMGGGMTAMAGGAALAAKGFGSATGTALSSFLARATLAVGGGSLAALAIFQGQSAAQKWREGRRSGAVVEGTAAAAGAVGGLVAFGTAVGIKPVAAIGEKAAAALAGAVGKAGPLGWAATGLLAIGGTAYAAWRTFGRNGSADRATRKPGGKRNGITMVAGGIRG